MNRSLRQFRFLTLTWAGFFILSIYGFIVGMSILGYGSLVFGIGTVAFQIIEFECTKCNAKPAMYLFAFWAILFDPELYLIDTLTMKHCPKCNHDFRRTDS